MLLEYIEGSEIPFLVWLFIVLLGFVNIFVFNEDIDRVVKEWSKEKTKIWEFFKQYKVTIYIFIGLVFTLVMYVINNLRKDIYRSIYTYLKTNPVIAVVIGVFILMVVGMVIDFIRRRADKKRERIKKEFSRITERDK